MRRTGVLVLAVAACGIAAGAAQAHPAKRDGLQLEIGRERVQRDTAPKAVQAQVPVAPATPRAQCAPGSRPEGEMQGRVPAGHPDGFTCNMTLVGQQGSSGGYKALRFIDKQGRECAYYDTTLLFPSNVQTLSERPTGTAVLDMSDPRNPKQTASLPTPAMQSPHESLLLNEKRGLLAAVMGNPAFAPGWVDVYDLNEDCRAPQLQSSLPVGLLGHESGFAPDGRTFYATSISTGQVTAVDLSDPKLPRTLAVGQYPSHGLMISDDGNRAYIAGSDGLQIVDVSDIQQRRPDPQYRTISTLTWPEMTIPQVATPITIDGHPYLMEIDEFSTDGVTSVSSNGPIVGAARIIDIADERNPKVISNIRLQVHQPENRAAIAADPGAQSPAQGYAGHYCNVPQRRDPGIVACSMIVSGLRVFDIRDPRNPKEIAYYVAPNKTSQTAGQPSNYAMSSPAFVPERREIWYTDGNSGFYNVRLDNWPTAQGAAAGDCTGDEGFATVTAQPRGRTLRLAYTKRRALPAKAELFQVSQGRRIIEERRVARTTKAHKMIAKRLPDGFYFARFTMAGADVRRIVLQRKNGRWRKQARHYRRGSCELLRSYKLERPVFGGRANKPLRIAYRLTTPAKVNIVVTRGKKTVARRTVDAQAARTYRIALKAKRRGVYKVRFTSGDVAATLTARRL